MSKTKSWGETALTPSEGNGYKPWIVQDNISRLMGEVLTVIDASTEGEKNKAMKDLIKGKFSEVQGWFSELQYKQVEEEGSGHEPRQQWEDGLIPYVAYNGKVYCFRQ